MIETQMNQPTTKLKLEDYVLAKAYEGDAC